MSEDSRAWKDQYMVRFPDGMRERLKLSAKDAGRSLNAEIIAKLGRYDSLGGEVDLLTEILRSLSDEIDRASGIPNGSDDRLAYRISEALAAVDEMGNADHAKLAREFVGEAVKRLGGALFLPPALRARIEAKATERGTTVNDEALSALEGVFPSLPTVEEVAEYASVLIEAAAHDPEEQKHLSKVQAALQHLVSTVYLNKKLKDDGELP